MGKAVLPREVVRFNLWDSVRLPNQSQGFLGAGKPKSKHGPSHRIKSNSSTCDDDQRTDIDTSDTEGIWHGLQKALGLAYKLGGSMLTIGGPGIGIINDITGGSGPPISPNRPHRSLPKKPVIWKDNVRNLEIRQGPLCKNLINGMLCYHTAYVFKNDGPEEDYFDKIIASQMKLMRRSLSKDDATLLHRMMARRTVNEDGGGVPVLTCGIYLCGFEETKLSPRLVVSCNGILSIPSLAKEFHDVYLRSPSPYDAWLTYAVSLTFPDTDIEPRFVAKSTDTPEELEASSNAEYVPEHLPTAPETDSIPTGTYDSPKPVCYRPESLDDPWKVYTDDYLFECREIWLPKRVYIGKSPERCEVATIGGLIEFEGHAEPYGLTVGHALNPEDTADNIISKVSTGSSLSPGNDSSVKNGGSSAHFTMIGIVVGKHSDSDWAVVKFEDEFQVFSSITPSALSGPRFTFPRDTGLYHKEVTIHCETSVLRGWLGPYPYLIHPIDSLYWLVTYPIRLRLPGSYRAEPGDSGSWVMDTENNLCGQLCFGSRDSPMVWMVTAKRTFDEILSTSKQNIVIGSEARASFQSDPPSPRQPSRRHSRCGAMRAPEWTRIVL